MRRIKKTAACTPRKDGTSCRSGFGRTGRIALCGVLTAAALILSYLESLLPLPLPVPGIKLGLSNIAVLAALELAGPSCALCVLTCRIILSSMLFSGPASAVYSLCGGLLSLAAEILLRKTGKFSLCGISMAGGVFHNLGQLLCAALVTGTPGVLSYFFVLDAAGLACGAITGAILCAVLSRIPSPSSLRSDTSPKGGGK